MSEARRYADLALYRRLFAEARPLRRHLVGLLLLHLLAAPLALLLPLPAKIVVDHVLGDEPMPAILQALVPEALRTTPATLLLASCASLVLIAALVQGQQLLRWVWQTWVGQQLILRFRSRLLDHLQRLSLAFHHRQKVSDSIYRLQFDAGSIQAVALDGAIPFVTSLVTVIVLLAVTAGIDGTLALIAIATGPPLFLVTELYRRRLRRTWAAARAEESSAMGVAQESLSAVRIVKAFGQEERERARYLERAHASVGALVRAVRAHGTFDLVVGLLVGVAGAVLLWVGARHVQTGRLSLGELLLVTAYLSQLFHPLRDLGTRVGQLQGALASAARVFDLLDEPREVQARAGGRPLERARGQFTFEDVSFAYEPGAPVLEDVTLEVPAGSRVGIAGRTGAGKSTLLSLLPRFYDPTTGTIRLDGVDLRDLDLADLRRQFAIVLQESVLFSTTIRENIRYGRPEATDAEVEEAARAAAAHEFVTDLPHGYDSPVGERGMRLSGGERQRIALARAFVRDAPVLILDEPTSALDTGTEEAVMEALERLMAGRTVFVIAHRLSTLEGCDLRLEVGDGTVRVAGDVADVTLEPPPPSSGLDELDP